MQVILAPFHLENSLVEEILKYKNTDPLCPLLILVPSDALRRHLKVLLTKERKLSFINLQLLTFHQLSAKLFAEAKGVNPPVLRDDLFLEEALRQIIRARHPGIRDPAHRGESKEEGDEPKAGSSCGKRGRETRSARPRSWAKSTGMPTSPVQSRVTLAAGRGKYTLGPSSSRTSTSPVSARAAVRSRLRLRRRIITLFIGQDASALYALPQRWLRICHPPGG